MISGRSLETNFYATDKATNTQSLIWRWLHHLKININVLIVKSHLLPSPTLSCWQDFCPVYMSVIIWSSVTCFGPGGLRAPCVLACAMRRLAIVITIIQSFSPLSFFLFSPSFAFDPLWEISRA